MGKSSKKGCFLLNCLVKYEGPRQDSNWTDDNLVNNYFGENGIIIPGSAK